MCRDLPLTFCSFRFMGLSDMEEAKCTETRVNTLNSYSYVYIVSNGPISLLVAILFPRTSLIRLQCSQCFSVVSVSLA